MGKVEGLLILLAIILLLFGAKKLPQLARGVGDSVRELKSGLSGNTNDTTTTSPSTTAAKKTDTPNTEQQ